MCTWKTDTCYSIRYWNTLAWYRYWFYSWLQSCCPHVDSLYVTYTVKNPFHPPANLTTIFISIELNYLSKWNNLRLFKTLIFMLWQTQLDDLFFFFSVTCCVFFPAMPAGLRRYYISLLHLLLFLLRALSLFFKFNFSFWLLETKVKSSVWSRLCCIILLKESYKVFLLLLVVAVTFKIAEKAI